MSTTLVSNFVVRCDTTGSTAHSIVLLFRATDSYFNCETPLRVTLPMMEQIRLAMPDVLKIWEFSPTCLIGRDAADVCRMQEEICREGLENGTLTLESVFVPEGLKARIPRRM